MNNKELIPYFIANKENKDIFTNVCTKLQAPSPKFTIIDKLSLADFVRHDLKQYSFCSHYVFDLSAIKEKDDELLTKIESVPYQTQGKIIIYADEFYEGDELLDKLVHKGFTNIVANYRGIDTKTAIAQMQEDLCDCFGEDGLPKEKWRRYDKSYDAFAEARERAVQAEKEQSKPRYTNANIRIAVVGAQNRIGTTTFAIHLAEYFRSREAQSAVICTNDRGISQLEMISEFNGGEHIKDNYYAVNGIDFCSVDTDANKEYNAEIYDFGTFSDTMSFTDFDKVYLVSGTSWNEIPMVFVAQQELNSVNYTVAVNFSDDSRIARYKEYLSRNLNDVVLVPHETNLFASDKFEAMFDRDFEDWCDHSDEEESEEHQR